MKNCICTLLFSLLVISSSWAQEKRILSKVRTNFSEGAPVNKVLTTYSYDTRGNKIKETSYNGVDTLQTPLSAIGYVYNEQNRLMQKNLFTGNTVLSTVNNAYAGANLVSVRTMTVTGAFRFMDSLVYGPQANLIEERRHTAVGMTFFHRYTYDANKLRITDTLFEKSDAAYLPKQATLFTYNPDSSVSTRLLYRNVNNVWHLISTKKMVYGNILLLSETEYERDGSTGRKLDSLAFTYDSTARLIKEERFNEKSELVHTVEYTWGEIVGIISHRYIRNNGGIKLSFNDRVLTVTNTLKNPAILSLYDFRGRQIFVEKRRAIQQTQRISIPGALSTGTYVACVQVGNLRNTLKFTLSN
jgi:hypothetical protein